MELSPVLKVQKCKGLWALYQFIFGKERLKMHGMLMDL